MDNGKAALVVVLGYGCHLSLEMKKYLDGVVRFSQTNKVTAIITTGGFTNKKSAPGVSEAGMMAEYLKRHGITAPIYLEERATTTYENILMVARIVHERQIEDCHMVIFCDESRRFKVKIFAWSIFGYWPTISTYDLTKNLAEKIKQIFIATPLDVLASQIPVLEKLRQRRKKRIMKAG